MEAITEAVRPVFIDGSAGRIFVLHYQPMQALQGHIIYIPPLAEEMNRCRNLVATQAAHFARAGYSCTIVDLFGTGDSEGDLCDATWDKWREDVESVVGWLLSWQRAPVVLWGLRLGGLLALDLAETSSMELTGLLLWQPVVNGKSYFTQVLRQRLASMVESGLETQTTNEMRQLLASGGSVEVGGYTIGGELSTSLDQISVSQYSDISGLQILWCEHASDPDKPLLPASQKAIANLESLGNTVEVVMHSSPPLWQLHKRAQARELLELTSSRFGLNYAS